MEGNASTQEKVGHAGTALIASNRRIMLLLREAVLAAEGKLAGTRKSSVGGSTGQKSQKAGSSDEQAVDPCNIKIATNLQGARASVLSGLKVGVKLSVALRQERFVSVVCEVPWTGDIAGSLAAVEGLAQLIDCIKAGHVYEATVAEIEGGNCTVLVERSGGNAP